ncbi:hypothetical protein [Cohnella soli]|uniref:Uncharacterized protein n=1 Tax=Cohnella soli TaxID=425005 RepID=A0ABW0HQA4_9BACL
MREMDPEKLFNKFKKVVDARDSQKIDKALYEHLHLHTGFIAHYDIHGFRETYSDRGFLDFVDHFENCFYLTYGKHGDFNQRLKAYILEHAADIRLEFQRAAELKELSLLNALANKHGLSVQPKAGSAAAAVPVRVDLESTISNSGQYEFAF